MSQKSIDSFSKIQKCLDYFPNIEVLQELIKPAQINNIDNLLKAIRLGITLRKLYEPTPEFEFEKLTYVEWRDFLFEDAKAYHPKDNKPTHEDSKCICSKTLKELLFQPNRIQQDWLDWKKSFIKQYHDLISLDELKIFLEKLEESKPFFVTGKTIESDLKYLAEKKHFLEITPNLKPKCYFKISHVTNINDNKNILEVTNCDEYKFHFLLDEFGFVAENLEKPINNIQRFYIHPDYKTLNQDVFIKIMAIIQNLKEVWQSNSLIPITLDYHSASLSLINYPAISKCTIYPICIYFYQKAFYLCGFGQTPREKTQGNWYNYRLDHIKSLDRLEVENSQIPEYLQNFINQSMSKNDIYSIMQEQIDYIEKSLQEAYGFDFYEKDAEMILCFPPEFNQSYNRDTFRHETFKEKTYQEVKQQIENSNITKQQKQLLLNKLKDYQQKRYGYYKLQYRTKDYSVFRRLRDWADNVEVLLPWQLRQEIRQNIEANWNRYKDDCQ